MFCVFVSWVCLWRPINGWAFIVWSFEISHYDTILKVWVLQLCYECPAGCGFFAGKLYVFVMNIWVELSCPLQRAPSGVRWMSPPRPPPYTVHPSQHFPSPVESGEWMSAAVRPNIFTLSGLWITLTQSMLITSYNCRCDKWARDFIMTSSVWWFADDTAASGVDSSPSADGAFLCGPPSTADNYPSVVYLKGRPMIQPTGLLCLTPLTG